MIGRPDELRQQLFSTSLQYGCARRWEIPRPCSAPMPEVQGWEQTPSGYATSTTLTAVAPAVARALVEPAPTSCRSPSPTIRWRTSISKLIDEDVEARSR